MPAHLDLPIWSAAPFVLLLLAIALLPLVAGHWWHSNRNKALVALLFALPTAAYLVYVQRTTGQPAVHALGHELGQYLSFIILLGSLYTVSGGIVLRGDLEARPLTNAAFLAFGSVLANLIGTTGASVLLIRPLVRINRQRRNKSHLAIFFIFMVCNLGGLLTPLGDPPLFLGFLNGVPFFWTLRLWRPWLVANGLVLAIFFVWDTIAYRREAPAMLVRDRVETTPLRVEGWINVPFLAGVLAAVFIQGTGPAPWGDLAGALVMASMAFFSLKLTHRDLRAANEFGWGPIIEVAILFLGIFVCMVPALELLSRHGHELGITEPWQFFWLTGGLSSVLDNAPTYLTFATMAAGTSHFGQLVHDQVHGLNGPLVLQAISCGAVFMGAMTYIGNGPNFMVKAIADERQVKTPSFFGYLAYSFAVLLPVFALVSWLFFRG